MFLTLRRNSPKKESRMESDWSNSWSISSLDWGRKFTGILLSSFCYIINLSYLLLNKLFYLHSIPSANSLWKHRKVFFHYRAYKSLVAQSVWTNTLVQIVLHRKPFWTLTFQASEQREIYFGGNSLSFENKHCDSRILRRSIILWKCPWFVVDLTGVIFLLVWGGIN